MKVAVIGAGSWGTALALVAVAQLGGEGVDGQQARLLLHALGADTAALLITRGLAEMSRMVVAAGGEALTCMGLGGAGDMVVTCMSQHSRNRRFGERTRSSGAGR